MSSLPAVAVEVAAVAAAITDRSAAGIAGGLSRLISSGRIGAGERLPTVRELAAELGTSPATVAEAWRALTATGAIVARGRAGTFVSTRDRPPTRYDRLAASVGAPLALDLSTGVPDPALLPDLRPALARVASPSRDQQLPRRAGAARARRAAARPTGPTRSRRSRWSTARWTASTGWPGSWCVSAITSRSRTRASRRCSTCSSGSAPSSCRSRWTSAGCVRTRWRRCSASEPVALVVQPRAQNPTGLSMTAARVRALARTIRAAGSAVVVIEDNHSGSIAHSGDLSLGQYLLRSRPCTSAATRSRTVRTCASPRSAGRPRSSTSWSPSAISGRAGRRGWCRACSSTCSPTPRSSPRWRAPASAYADAAAAARRGAGRARRAARAGRRAVGVAAGRRRAARRGHPRGGRHRRVAGVAVPLRPAVRRATCGSRSARCPTIRLRSRSVAGVLAAAASRPSGTVRTVRPPSARRRGAGAGAAR